MIRREASPPAELPVANAREVSQSAFTRRSFLGAAATTLAIAAGCGAAPAASAARASRLRLTLFPPTGPYAIGIASLYLIDHSRRDPWVSSQPLELMVSVWYPARNLSSHPRAPWMPKAAGALFLKQLIPQAPTSSGTTSKPAPSVSLHGVSLPITDARRGAPVDLSAGPYPVVLYQPGYGDDRELGTGLVSDLASHGYIVVTIDDIYEAAEVELPNGRVAVPPRRPSPTIAASARVDDTRFVLDELVQLSSGVNPDANDRALPAGLAQALDLTKIGMFGHSLGGATAATAMAADARIGAGIDLDGSIFLAHGASQAAANKVKKLAAAVAKQIGDRPFMIMSSHGLRPNGDPSWAGFWPNLKGWRLFLTLRHSEHYTYTDQEEFLSQLLAAGIIPRRLANQIVTPTIGTIKPAPAVAAERAYIGAFFDQNLRNITSSLLTRPSPRYPDIQFLGT